MTYADHLAKFSAAQIIAATGCPKATAYAWLDGSRQPPAWQQRHWIAMIAKSKPVAVKKPGRPRIVKG